MKALSPKFRYCASVLAAVLAGSVLAAPSLAARYPASISAPKVNEQIIAPVTPTKKVDVVVVPKATAEIIPTIVAKNPSKRAFQETPTPRPITTSVTPRSLATSVILGGILKRDISKSPIASVSVDKSAEIQVPSDVPVRLELTNLVKSVDATVYVVAADGSVTRLGIARVNSNGSFTLPPITTTKSGVSFTIRIEQAGKILQFLVRSVA